MNWNTTYHIYEGLALLWIVTTWWAIAFGAPLATEADYQSVNSQLERVYQKAFDKNQNTLEMLCLDVEYQGNSREGKERISRAEALNTQINKTHQKINKVRNQCKKSDLVGEDYAVYSALGELKWVERAFKDLDFHPKGPIRYSGLNFFPIPPLYATKAFLLSYQIILEKYKTEVLYKLGAEGSRPIRCRFGWRPYPIAHSHLVQVGDEYKADIFDNRYSDLYNVKYFVNNRIIKNNRFAFDTEGKGKKYFNITIQYRTGYRDRLQTIEKKIPYIVLPK